MTRLPVKRKQVTSTSTDILSSIIGSSTSKAATSATGIMSTWMKGGGSFSKKSISFSSRISRGTDDPNAEEEEADNSFARPARRNSLRSSIEDAEFAAALDIPRTLGELFPQKTKPIVISIGEPNKRSPNASASATDCRKAFKVIVSVIAARGLGVKESVRCCYRCC